MKKHTVKKHIAIMHEKGQYDDNVKYEFDSAEQLRWFVENMRGVLVCSEAYTEIKYVKE